MRALAATGIGRTPDTVMPPGSNATTSASDGTPGSATYTMTAEAVSMTSTGGSQCGASAGPARSNWRCRRSACSSSDSASPQIQDEKSRDLMNLPSWPWLVAGGKSADFKPPGGAADLTQAAGGRGAAPAGRPAGAGANPAGPVLS